MWFGGRGMLEPSKGVCDAVRHGQINRSIFAVPIQVNATEELAVLVDGDGTVFLQAGDEVVSVSLANDFDAKVIDDKIEGCGTGDVAEKSRGVAGGDVAIIGEVLD